MSPDRNRNYNFDWTSILIYVLLVGFGWVNILSASQTGEITSYFDIGQPYGKQAIFIILSFILIILILSVEAKFYERFSGVIYILSIISLIGLFLFGKTVSGATSWYGIGGFTIQPSEFAKVATSLAVAKYISDLQTNVKIFNDQVKLIIIIAIPAILVLLQNDTGSTIVYGSFFFVLYREGLPRIYLQIAAFFILISISALKFGTSITVMVASILILIYYFTRKKKPNFLIPLGIIILALAVSYGVRFTYTNLLPAHQKDRITVWLSLEKDPAKLERMKKTVAYNLNESERAIGSGGFNGKGFMEGTRTTGKFVPEQHTDYIFSTVGEEWGFIGSALVVILFVLLIVRILKRAELQKSQFSRVYGYAVASIFFIHFLINIGMVMGLIPTIGIPLPFFSYGGSGILAYTLLLFIFIRLDSNRINEW